jgi:SNF2 family DNA or RNA helicase
MKVIPYKDHLVIPDDNRVAVMVPHAKRFTDPQTGQQLMLVPHRVDETQVLRNLGYEVRPPVLTGYDWPSPPGTEPFDAQRITTALITTHRRSFVLNGLGTGKTRSALYAFDYLRKTGQAPGKLIVTAPLSTLRQTWAREVELVFPHLRYAVLHGTKAKRVALLDSDSDVLIINHDGVETIIAELVARKDQFSLAVLDELSVYKNPKTDMWKATYRFISEVDRVTGMTATPMPLAATDAYGQIKMLAPAALKGESYGRFRERVQNKVCQFRWVNKRDALDTVFKLMQPAVRFTRDECYDMPPCQTVVLEAELSAEQRAMFREMQDECAVKSKNVLAVNAADQINKLLQICLGVVYDVDRNVIELDVSSRMKILEGLIEQSASKVIVFTPYKASLRKLHDELQKRWTVAAISGDVPTGQREKIFTLFMHSPAPQVLVAHPECMSHGLTLTEASTIVWWGPPQSLETFEQANGRITRAGQRHSQLIACLTATKLEQQIFRLLQRRANVQNTLLDMFESKDIGDLM